MGRSTAVSFGRIWMLVLLLGLVGAAALTADRAGAEETEVDSTPPTFNNGVISPSNFSYEGGNAQISVEITDDSGAVHMTSAQVFGSDGSYQAINLYEGFKDNYFGTLEVPANYSESAMSYSVEVHAYDLNNNFNAGYIGEVQVEGQPQFDEAPWISMTEMWPQFLPREGGTVTISAEAGDNRGLSAVYGSVTLPGGGSAEVPLQAVSSSRFEGTYEVPANNAPSAAEYLVEVVVQDDIGQESRASAGTITVEAAPPPLSKGLLEAWPSERSFGSVRVGKEAQRTVFVRNLKRPGAEPVTATARIAGSSDFSILGASTGGLHFELDPGEKQAITVAFRPTAAGQHTGALEIVRDDGGQAGLSVALSGRGTSGR